jgi:phenylalanine-4-hydroxylase
LTYIAEAVSYIRDATFANQDRLLSLLANHHFPIISILVRNKKPRFFVADPDFVATAN